jgi:thiamine-phosphate pyrophosphorylase
MVKKEKYFYLDSIQDLDFDYIKKTKARLIVRDKIKHNHVQLYKLANKCKNKQIPLYIANNIKLLFKLRLQKFYISSSNLKNYNWLYRVNKNIQIIGSAHNNNEINRKKNQGCSKVILSRLFRTYKIDFFNIIKFNMLTLNKKISFIALGGINQNNYKKLKMVRCLGYAMLSEPKKKPKYLLYN